MLFDQNVSPDLVRRLTDVFPGSDHVFNVGLDEADDIDLWQYARDHGFIVVSKDADFSEISMVHGFPPKLLWLRLGNCRTEDIEELIRANHQFIVQLVDDDERGILTLFGKSPP